MSLARKHRDTVLASLSAAAAPAEEGGLSLPASTGPEGAAGAQVALRLTHDLRRLKQIQSLEKKIDAKREMIPEYASWISGILAAGTSTGHGVADPVVPTIMVWKIDTGDFVGALELAEYVLRHRVPMPAQYQRQPATLVVEEISDAAIRMLTDGEAFPLDVLEELEALTADEDMPDEVRSKLFKAIGLEYDRRSGTEGGEGQDRALDALRRAHRLNERGGVKDRIKKIERSAAKRGDGKQGAPTETRPPAETADLTPNDDVPVVENQAASAPVVDGQAAAPEPASETRAPAQTADQLPNDDTPVVENPASTVIAPDASGFEAAAD